MTRRQLLLATVAGAIVGKVLGGEALAQGMSQGMGQGMNQGMDGASKGRPAPRPAHGHAPAAAAPGTAPSAANPARGAAPRDAYVYIGWPQDGVAVGTRFKVWFGTRNFGVAPAGITTPNTGHHHLLIDAPLPPLNEPIPNDRNHLHFGLGQTETMVELPPGTHTLQLLMGDADHVPHDPPVMSRRITIQVRAGRPTMAQAPQ